MSQHTWIIRMSVSTRLHRYYIMYKVRGRSRRRVQGGGTPLPLRWSFLLRIFVNFFTWPSVMSFLRGAPSPKKNPGSAPEGPTCKTVVASLGYSRAGRGTCLSHFFRFCCFYFFKGKVKHCIAWPLTTATTTTTTSVCIVLIVTFFCTQKNQLNRVLALAGEVKLCFDNDLTDTLVKYPTHVSNKILLCRSYVPVYWSMLLQSMSWSCNMFGRSLWTI